MLLHTVTQHKTSNLKIAITGSEGMLGYDVVRRLDEKHNILCIDIDNFNIVDSKIVDYLLEEKPEFIFHLAAYTNVDGAETQRDKASAINITGTKNIVKACQKLDIPILFISSDYVFDGTKEASYTETDSPNPVNFYGRTKKEAEDIIKNNLTKFFIVRTSWLFGRNGKNFVKTIKTLTDKTNKIKVVNDQYGAPTYTKDLAYALEMFIPSKKYGIYHITNSGKTNWFNYAKTIVSLYKKKTEIIPVSSAEFKRAAKRPSNSLLDNSYFEDAFHYKMPLWEDGLKRYLLEKRRIA